MVDKDYIEEQIKFINSLEDWEKYFLESYTSLGFFFVTEFNPFNPTPDMLKRGMAIIQRIIDNDKKNLPAYTKIFYPKELKDIKPEDLPKLAEEYGARLYNIFQKAPKLKYPIKLYRGLRDTKFDQSKQGLVISTTYKTDWKGFSNFMGENCCLLELKVYPGIQTILVIPEISAMKSIGWEQHEIIFLSPNVDMKCDDKEIRKQNIEGKNISVFECSVLPKGYDPSKPLQAKPTTLGGKTRRKRKLRKTQKSKNQRARQ